MKFAICNETYQDLDWPFERQCEHVATCGYDGIEIAPFTFNPDPSRITPAQAREIGKTASRAGLELVGMHWLLAKPAGLHITTPEDDVRRRTVAFLQHLARLLGEMGGGVMVHGSPAQRDLVEGDTYDQAFDRATGVFRQFAQVAEQAGVTIALEPLGPAETTFMVTVEETVDLMRAIDHPACRLHLDVKAMCQEDKPIDQLIAENARHTAHFHANDANRRGPGFGQTDFVPIAKALKDVDYDKYVSVEVFDYSPDPQTIAHDSLTHLKKTFSQVGAI
ncbi:MAG: sugar phosphate isomerase/epimerase family protein [Phycisphaeraceae bacterium]|jgi:sugar phosphate isomerase/epimerase|nr:sugar phosphate isomerase/epimerase family protein [Phycisphaeraceae bacterium]